MTIAYTVALCTHNQAERLTTTLEDLSKLMLPNRSWELLVVDNGSKDCTPEMLKDYEWPTNWKVQIVREEKIGLSNARNRAITESKGEYIIFMDDDETVDPDWLCAYERLINDKNPDAFGGRIRVAFEEMRPSWLNDDLLCFLGELNRSNEISPLSDQSTTFYGGNFGFHKRVYPIIGGFDSMLGRKSSDNTGGEEVDFYRRLLNAGFSVWWTPEAVIYHRIQAAKLTRIYFLDLHYRQGRMESIRMRGEKNRIPPLYLYGQIIRAILSVLNTYRDSGWNATLRKEMNVAYFLGRIVGWAFGPTSGVI